MSTQVLYSTKQGMKYWARIIKKDDEYYLERLLDWFPLIWIPFYSSQNLEGTRFILDQMCRYGVE
jgi:hypothetical protein